MIGLGTLINTGAVIIGGILGWLFGNFIKEQHQESLTIACGVSTLFIGIAGAMSGMLTANGSVIESGQSMLVVICLVLGTLIGEIINIEKGFERFGEWLKHKTGNSKDAGFVDGFVTASLVICIGAMAIVGSIKDGLYGDYSILAVKSILDLIIIMIMTCSMGKGAAFSFVPIFILEGAMTIGARFLQPVLNDTAMNYISLIGSILIFCVGLNLVWGKKVRVANMLPALIFAVVASYIPM